MFEQKSPAPPDSILGLTEAFKRDPNAAKINLGVGVYKDDAGATPVLHCVKEAEQRLAAEQTSKNYMPIPGAPEYGVLVQGLLFGEGGEVVQAGRARTAHTPGGTGGLRVGADTIKLLAPETTVWLSNPTWANHRGVFGAAGLRIAEYPYYDAATHGVDWEAMKQALRAVPAGDVVLLHVSCHNPTGVDLTAAQWAEVAGIATERGWTPFLDFAYQGFSEDLEADAAPLEAFTSRGIEFFVASSFSKNMGLYCERVGAITLVGATAEQAATAFSHMELVIRRNYSNPPAHGGAVVATVLRDETLRKLWVEEVAGMRERIKQMRAALVRGLQSRGVERDFSFIERQRGMFSFSGLNDDQVAWLREHKSIYIVKGGRINVAGITSRNIDALCDALVEALG
jgi:aspartate/tyrosine/aromatic aminotransferase